MSTLSVRRLVQVFQRAWHEADAIGDEGRRTEAGIVAVLAAQEAKRVSNDGV